jgi:protoheme IX farnesyltransferase
LLAEKTYVLEKETSVTSKVKDYAQFAKLRLASLVVFSAALAYLTGTNLGASDFSWMKLAMLVLGGFLVTGASNGFNQVIEKDLDKMMSRTATRPLPQERMSVAEALVVAALMGIAGVVILYIFINPMSAILGALALVLYTIVYTPLKRKTPFAVFVGAFPGAIPPMLGWVAATEGFGTIGLQGWVLFAVQFLWQFPHFWSLAWVLDEDYKKAGFRMLPTGERDRSSAFQVLVYTLFLIPTSLLPVMFRMSGSISGIVILACGIYFAWQAYNLYKNCTVKSAQQLMFGGFLYLPIVQLVITLGY